MTKRALVFGGGGVAGIAWETGILEGIRSVDPDLAEQLVGADVLVGTSAGAAVAAQLAGGTPLPELHAAQLAEETAELNRDLDLAAFGATMTQALAGVTSPEEGRRRLGELALAAETVSEARRRAIIAARLPTTEWPRRTLLITAVDTADGSFRVFDRESGVDLIDAVAASCAVPGIWPPVTINGRRIHGRRHAHGHQCRSGCGRRPRAGAVPGVGQLTAGSIAAERVGRTGAGGGARHPGGRGLADRLRTEPAGSFRPPRHRNGRSRARRPAGRHDNRVLDQPPDRCGDGQ